MALATRRLGWQLAYPLCVQDAAAECHSKTRSNCKKEDGAIRQLGGGGKRRRKGNVHDADAGAEAGPSWKETKQLDQANIRDGSTSSGALALGRPAASQVAKPSGFRGRMDVQGSMIQWIVGI